MRQHRTDMAWLQSRNANDVHIRRRHQRCHGHLHGVHARTLAQPGFAAIGLRMLLMLAGGVVAMSMLRHRRHSSLRMARLFHRDVLRCLRMHGCGHVPRSVDRHGRRRHATGDQRQAEGDAQQERPQGHGRHFKVWSRPTVNPGRPDVRVSASMSSVGGQVLDWP